MTSGQTINRAVIATFFLCFITACSTDAVSNDFDLVCRYFTELQADPSGSSMTPAERNQAIMTKLTENLAEDSHALIAWQAISNAEPSERYALFKSAASSSGINNWECPAMQVLASTTGEFE